MLKIDGLGIVGGKGRTGMNERRRNEERTDQEGFRLHRFPDDGHAPCDGEPRPLIFSSRRLRESIRGGAPRPRAKPSALPRWRDTADLPWRIDLRRACRL